MFQEETKMARPTSITQRQIDFIIKATSAKMTTREIADQIGMSQMTVVRQQKKLGLSKPTTPTLTFK